MIEPQVEQGGASSNMRGGDTGAAARSSVGMSATRGFAGGSEMESGDCSRTPASTCFSGERNFKANQRKM
jgi:hypothetical protein